MKYISMYNGKYDPKMGLTKVTSKVVITIQDAIVEIPALFEAFNGHLKDLFDKYNNRCVYESNLGPVFVDTLDKASVDRYNEYLKRQKELEDEKRKFDDDFEAWRHARAEQEYSPVPAPDPASSSLDSSVSQ